MGLISVDSVIAALQAAGIPAAHSYPVQKMIAIKKPVAAVSLLDASLRQQTMTVLVQILSPMDSGGAVCEEKALEAGGILSELGGECSIGECRLDGQTGLYYSDIKVRFLTEIPKVMVGDVMLTHVEAFTSWRMLDAENGITQLLDAPWCFRLEEFFPTGSEEESDCSEPFELMHISSSGTESYVNAKWTYQKRTWGSTGIRQIRLGTAERMDNG